MKRSPRNRQPTRVRRVSSPPPPPAAHEIITDTIVAMGLRLLEDILRPISVNSQRMETIRPRHAVDDAKTHTLKRNPDGSYSL